MPAHFDLLIRHGTCILPWGAETTDVGVRNGRIAALGVAGDASAEETIDAGGLHVLPGLIDPHVHLRDPGDKTIEFDPHRDAGRGAGRAGSGVRHAEHRPVDR